MRRLLPRSHRLSDYLPGIRIGASASFFSCYGRRSVWHGSSFNMLRNLVRRRPSGKLIMRTDMAGGLSTPLPQPVLGRLLQDSRSYCGRGRRDGPAGRGGLPYQFNLRRGQGAGLVNEVAERALQVQGFGGEGARRRAEKLKWGKQSTLRSPATEDGKAEIVGRRGRRSAVPSCPRCAALR
jgi:hypothetical protein